MNPEPRSARHNQFPSTDEIVAFLNSHIVGQDDAKLALASGAYIHYLMAGLDRITESESRRAKSNLLIVGPTGTGKTALVKLLAEFLGVPFAYMSATALTQEGYIGKKPEDIIRSLLSAANWDEQLAQHGIIFIDEIDKIRQTDARGSVDVSGQGAQTSLLPFLDGAEYRVGRQEKGNSSGLERTPEYTVDTRHTLIIAAGAFQLADRGKTKPTLRGERKDLSLDDLAEYGLIDELLARFSRVINLRPLGLTELKEITQRSPRIVELQSLFALHDVSLQIEDSAVQLIAEQACRYERGARPIAEILTDSLHESVSGLTYLAGTEVVLIGNELGELSVEYRGVPHSRKTNADLVRRILPRMIFPGRFPHRTAKKLGQLLNEQSLNTPPFSSPS